MGVADHAGARDRYGVAISQPNLAVSQSTPKMLLVMPRAGI